MLPGRWDAILITAALFGGLPLLVEFAYRLGRQRRSEAEDSGHLNTIQAAVLGLLGLLLGFSFSGAQQRFVERQDLVAREANSIGTASLRADLLDEPHRGELKRALRQYVASRVELFEQSGEGLHRARAASEALHPAIWSAALAGVRARPEFSQAVLPPVNEVLDLHTLRMAAMTRHLPRPVLAVLLLLATVGLGSVGYASGLTRQRGVLLTHALALLVAAVLWMTIDLDHPWRGLIRMNQEPLLSLQQNLGR